MKIARLSALFVLLLALTGEAYGQSAAPPGPAGPGAVSQPQAPLEGTGPPGSAAPNFPSAFGNNFPASTGSADFPATTNPEGFSTTMPESGVGTGTDSTLGGSGTGSGGLGASTNAPFTESILGTGK